MKPQQTIEPVHARAEHPPIPGASKPTEPAGPAPAPIEPGKPEQAVLPVAQKPLPQPKVKKSSKKSGSGVTAAIIGTVVIVLGLAALAVVAYIKTKK